MKKIFFFFLFLISEVFAFNLTSAINELKCKSFSLSNEKMVGMYKYFDASKKLWFLYMPNEKYLLIHQTGKNKISEGAKTINIKDFSSISVKNGCITFGSYNGSNEWAKELSNKKYCLLNEKMVGMYKYFDNNNKLWFLYMPNEKYLLIHQTGKYTVKEGAQQVKINNYFKTIEVSSLGIVKFIPEEGCSETNTSSSQIAPPSVETNESNNTFFPPQTPSIQ